MCCAMRFVRTGCVFAAALGLLSLCGQALADEVHLKNGDRFTGTVVSEDDSVVVIRTEAAGEISIDKNSVDKVVVDQVPVAAEIVEKKEAPDLWSGEVTAGVAKSGGNTDTLEAKAGFAALRKTEGDELKLKGTGDYSETDGEEDAEAWAASARYGFDIFDGKWYNFYSLEADHDKFAAIDYRIVPSIGLGYRVVDNEEWKLTLDAAAGYEYTEYNDGTENTEEPILIGRSIFEKTFLGGSKLSNETAYYPTLDDFGQYRIKSETSFTNPLGDSLSLRLSFVVDYNSEPPEGIDKTDTQLISSLVYSF